MKLHKTRIAPTPSGFLHLGNAYSFLLTAAIAKQNNLKILLRIDDMDAQRVRKEYVEDIFETLRFLEIDFDEGPRNYLEYELAFSQKHRMALYEAALGELAANDLVYGCDCSRTRFEDCDCERKNISLKTVGVAWRLKTDPLEPVTVNVYGKEKAVTVLPDSMQHFNVRKKDGFPSYQLSSLVDDVHFGVDLIVRGEDLWDSTLAQLYLAAKLNYGGFWEATFHHHSLLADAAGEKLSKFAGALSVKSLRASGKIRMDILKMLPAVTGKDFFLNADDADDGIEERQNWE